jgi:uncharacterized DUF497 family protein
MRLTFDPAKNAKNIAERGLPFDMVQDLEWDTAIVREDTRRDYGEMRLRVLGRIEGRLHAVVVTPRGDELRVIRLRKANRKEEILYDQERSRTSGRG